MADLQTMVEDFLAQKRIAVAGASRSGKQPGNAIARKLRETGHEVVLLHREASELDGQPAYADLRAVPGKVDGLVVTTPPSAAPDLVRQCVENGVPRVWLHRSFGQGSVDAEAVRIGREHGLVVIDGACPMMYLKPVDVAHRCVRWVLDVFGKLPKPPA